MNIIKSFCKEFNIPLSNFETYVSNASGRIKKAKMPKKGGGSRNIIIPSWEIKIIQYWTILYYLKKLPSSKFATAYYKGSCILKNASQHTGGNYFLKVDIKSFFPSLTANMFIFELEKDHKEKPDDTIIKDLLEATNNEYFINALFYKGVCVIGYPSSPYMANYILKDFDEEIYNKLRAISQKLGEFYFTRYADDITVSCEKKGNKKLIYNIIKDTLFDKFDGKLELNSDKTKSSTKKGGSTKITGITICSDGRMTLHRKYKDHVRLLLSLYKKNILPEEDSISIPGHLNYIKSIDYLFFNRLYEKYREQIKKLI